MAEILFGHHGNFFKEESDASFLAFLSLSITEGEILF